MLGVVVDENLNLDKHLEYVTRKVVSRLGVIKTIRLCVNASFICCLSCVIGPVWWPRTANEDFASV